MRVEEVPNLNIMSERREKRETWEQTADVKPTGLVD